MHEIYQHANYYAIAFSFVDPATQADLFERYIAEYSHIPVRHVLDICCGPSVELQELTRRGFRATGVDTSAEMLNYLSRKCQAAGTRIDLVQADMRDFALLEPADFAFIMMGSIEYVTSTAGLLSHLACMGKALRPGGLYLIENLDIDWLSLPSRTPQTWTMTRDGITVQTIFDRRLADALEQTVCDRTTYVIREEGATHEIVDEVILRLFMPQEFRALVELQGDFELVGFFARYSTQPLTEAKSDNITLLRRR
jgi:SAM-dependent methyltransferase